MINPYLIDWIEDADGSILFKTNPAVVHPEDCEQAGTNISSDRDTGVAQTASVETSPSSAVASESLLRCAERVLDERNVYIMRSIMRDVVRRGTARRANVLGRRDIGGKTGTTNDQHDAWFSGFNSQLVATAWVGYDRQVSLGARETGGRTALPIWIDYMREVLQDVPEDELLEPEGMTSVLIDPISGKPTTADNETAIFEIFRTEYAPDRTLIKTSDGIKTEREIRQQEKTTEQLF